VKSVRPRGCTDFFFCGYRDRLRLGYREGADLDAKLPVLATYMGHLDILGTQHYLHLTAELFPEITARSETHFGDVIPRRVIS
jgi:hypothetical protein